jgi:protoporphyrinogen/coproporphyrinogen III oxidase
MSETVQSDVIIIGAGISGLSTAFWLQEKGHDVLILEKSDHWGGAIHSYRKDGFLVEEGPNSTLETTPLLTQLIKQAGVEDQKCYANDASDKRFILKHGELIPLPMSPGAFLRTKLFRLGTKLGLLKEPFISASAPDSNETIAEFVKRRLGTEFLDYAINPFVAGVYAGDPEKLSVKAAFPKLFELEQKYGGLIKGQIKGAKERKKNPEKSKERAKMFSFIDGMETLPRALAEKIIKKEHSVSVSRITKDDKGYSITATVNGEDRTYTCKALIIATPALAAAGLVKGLVPELEQTLIDIPYPPVAEVVTGYKHDEIEHPLDGFGYLIPEKEKRDILGTIFSSTIFPKRAPDGHALLTTFIGGMRQPENARLPENEIIQLALSEQHKLLGTPAQADFVHVTAWERAIPQYSLGHLERMAEIDAAETRNPGLYFCANYRGGISVGDCVKSADRIVGEVDGWLKKV